MKLRFPVICAAVLIAPLAMARTLQIQGVAGYLSEYELTADVSGPSADERRDELSGRLSVKHVGICTHAGPNETLGEIKIRFSNSIEKIEATLSYDGRECTYKGSFSESAIGFMTCNNNLTLPLKLWIK
jgi:hypothetical protein